VHLKLERDLMVKRNLDSEYFRIMRDGEWQDVCWTDLDWEDRIEFARKHNDVAWLMRMIQIMNDVAWRIREAYPVIEIKPVRLREETQISKTWLLNSLLRLTADIRLSAEEYDVRREG
jgi:hypothetical protein